MNYKKITMLLLSSLSLGINAQELMIGHFSNADTTAWEEEAFVGNTQYTITQLKGNNVLQAKSYAAASAFYKKVKVDVNKAPYLNWSWQVENTYANTNPRKKSGDDFPARIYVVVEGAFPWNTLALNYVFANNSESVGSNWKNPFTSNARMIVIDSGDARLKTMHAFKVNVKEDFKKYFDKDIDSIDGIAIMSDTDNSKSYSKAYFGDIYFSDK